MFPVNEPAQLSLPGSIPAVEVCDARDDERSTMADN